MNSLEWLARLVEFDTTSRNSNLNLIHFIQEWLLKNYNITSHLSYDPNEPKANLLATLPAAEGSITGGIVLSGHTDVVPVDGQDWQTDPFTLTQLDGNVFGRGTSDMKGFIAVALALIPEFLQQRLKHPIHFALSYDEEIGCRGAPFLIADFAKLGIQPTACIVGEPTEMRPVIAHKGIQVFRCRVHGNAAHSSLTPEGCNAIEYAAKLICYIRDIADEFKRQGPFDSHYDVSFSTLTTNLMKGGNAYNTIPAFCEFIFELRNLPETHPDDVFARIKHYIHTDLQPQMQMEHAAASVLLDQIATVPSFHADPNATFTAFTNKLTDNQNIHKVSYATEAGLFQQANIPTLVCGPGSIEQAHRANEFVSLAQLQQCEQFLRKIVC